ncbi:MAG: hypothetical protein PHQ00_06670, partial [Phycisphaerae bacterium]|nr:hypothetical protein [Phycisphaerae bacterium]
FIAAGDYDSADSVASKMMNDFENHKQVARRLWEIANRFDKFRAYKYSKTLCEKIIAHYPDDQYAEYAGLQLAKLTVYELIDKGDYASADSVVCGAIQNFSGHKQLSRRLYEIARQYAKSGALSYAKPLYGWLAAGFPDDKYGLRAASDYRALGDFVPDIGVSKVADIAIPKTKINLSQTIELTDNASKLVEIETFASEISSQIIIGEPAVVKMAIDRLIADFNNNPGQSEIQLRLIDNIVRVLLRLGGTYYVNGLSREQNSLNSDAAQYFEKALDIYKRIILQLPFSSTNIRAKYFCGDCYVHLGQCEKALPYFNDILSEDSKGSYAEAIQLARKRCTDNILGE